MKPIAVESKKSTKIGFILNEADLRRIVDLLKEQAKKIPEVYKTTEKFTIKYKNGVIAETESIDTVIEQENSGSGLIIRLKYELSTTTAQGDYYSSIEFINADADEDPGTTSIKYSFRGYDRDWVFVSSSLLNERIDKIKRFALNQYSRSLQFLMPLIFMIIFVLPMVINDIVSKSYSKNNSPSTQLKSMYKENKITGPIEAMICLEEMREANNEIKDKKSFKPVLYGFGAVGILILFYFFLIRYYPVYNFCWGEYKDIFQKRESARGFWLVIIGIGIMVSFIGGILANKLSIW